MTRSLAHKWAFAARFRRHAFGWRSQPAVQRVREATAEILKIAKKDPALAAGGAVLFLEKVSPALEQVDSSSGAIGTAVSHAIEACAKIICEEILLSSGLAEEAYARYAIEANQGTTFLATFRVIAKKYPTQAPAKILADLVQSTLGQEGKWFAAAKDAGLYDEAIALAQRMPCDPRTLTRAARDFAATKPRFAVEAGLAALRWIAAGYGYEITGAGEVRSFTREGRQPSARITQRSHDNSAAVTVPRQRSSPALEATLTSDIRRDSDTCCSVKIRTQRSGTAPLPCRLPRRRFVGFTVTDGIVAVPLQHGEMPRPASKSAACDPIGRY